MASAGRRRLRLNRRIQKNQRQLAALVQTALPVPPVDEIAGTLRALRSLGVRRIPARLRAPLEKRLAEGLAANMKTLDPLDLGVRGGFDELAKLFVTMLERVRFGQYGVRELRGKRSGLHGVFAGELFELIVLNHRGIQQELRAIANGQLDAIRALVATRSARVLNARGNRLTLAGKFDAVHRVTDILTWHGAQKRKFTDLAHVSFFTPSAGGAQLVTFLVETEVKLPRAASEFGDQMLAKQARFADADRIEFVMSDGTRRSFTPDEIIFDVAGINRVAVTTTSRPSETWRFAIRGDRRRGEAYLRVGLVIDVDELRRLVSVAFR